MITVENPVEAVLRDVLRERGRQQLLLKSGKIDCDVSDPATEIDKKISVVTEEFCEFIMELRAIRDGKLRYGAAATEGKQLAAVTVAIVEGLQEVGG